jgi:hypothetical protein
MQYAVKDLDGELLNAAVAKAEGLPTHPGRDRYVVATKIDHCWADQFEFLSWTDAGPIIEREGIAIYRVREGWAAVMPGSGGYVVDSDYIDVDIFDGERGAMPLIAAMRAFCASRFGESVELP